MWKMRGPVVCVIALTNFPRRRRTPPAMAPMPSRREPSNTFYGTFVHEVLCQVIAIGRNRGVSFFFPRQTCQAAAKIGKIDKASKLSGRAVVSNKRTCVCFIILLYVIFYHTHVRETWKIKTSNSDISRKWSRKMSLMILVSSLLARISSFHVTFL